MTIDGQNEKDNNRMLPQELLVEVFSHLAPKDLNTVMLVCKTWKNAAEARHTLWSWVKLRSLNHLCLKRLEGAREMAILEPPPASSPADYWCKLLQAVLRHPGLKKITLAVTVPKAEAHLLVQVFAKVEEIEILDKEGHATSTMCNVIRCVVETVLHRPHNLKKLLFLQAPSSQTLDPVSLATALNTIEVLEVGLNEEQTNLLLKMMQDRTSVKSLSLLKELTLSQLEPRHLLAAFDKLKVLLMKRHGQYLWGEPVSTTLCETVAAGTSLKKLQICGDLSQVNHEVLGKMTRQLEELNLVGTRNGNMMRDQIGTIIEAVAAVEAPTLKNLVLYNIDFGLVDGCLLARMVTQVENLKLSSDNILDEDQAKAIFGAIAAAPGKLKKLSLSSKYPLASVDADVLASAANRLEFFEIDVVDFSSHHVEMILTKASEKTSLQKLIFNMTRGPGRGEPTRGDSKMIKEAEKVVPHISFPGPLYPDFCKSSGTSRC